MWHQAEALEEPPDRREAERQAGGDQRLADHQHRADTRRCSSTRYRPIATNKPIIGSAGSDRRGIGGGRARRRDGAESVDGRAEQARPHRPAEQRRTRHVVARGRARGLSAIDRTSFADVKEALHGQAALYVKLTCQSSRQMTYSTVVICVCAARAAALGDQLGVELARPCRCRWSCTANGRTPWSMRRGRRAIMRQPKRVATPKCSA